MADNGEMTFFQVALSQYWKINRPQEPTTYYSMREALCRFREYTNLSKEQIADQLSMSAYSLNMAEAGRKKFNLPQLDRLILLCKSHSLPKLAEYFDTWRDSITARTKATKGRDVYGAGGAAPNWRDMMGQ